MRSIWYKHFTTWWQEWQPGSFFRPKLSSCHTKCIVGWRKKKCWWGIPHGSSNNKYMIKTGSYWNKLIWLGSYTVYCSLFRIYLALASKGFLKSWATSPNMLAYNAYVCVLFIFPKIENWLSYFLPYINNTLDVLIFVKINPSVIMTNGVLK